MPSKKARHTTAASTGMRGFSPKASHRLLCYFWQVRASRPQRARRHAHPQDDQRADEHQRQVRHDRRGDRGGQADRGGREHAQREDEPPGRAARRVAVRRPGRHGYGVSSSVWRKTRGGLGF